MKLKTEADRLEAFAASANQGRRWKARRDGLLDRGAPSQVRSLKDDAEARAQAEASLQRAMMKSAGKR